MGSRYRYWTPDSTAPNSAAPPGLEQPEGPMFGPQYPSAVRRHSVGSHHWDQLAFLASMALLPWSSDDGRPWHVPHGPPSAPGMLCFPVSGPPPPYTQNPWGPPQAMAFGSPPEPPLANERPPQGARVNGQIAKFSNGHSHIHSKNNTTFHVVLDGSKPWAWPSGSNHRLQVYTAASSMPIDEFIEQVGAIEKAPYGTPREQIGVQECIEEGDGQFRPGVAFRLGDARITHELPDGATVFQTLEQLGWSSQRGQAGRGKPVTIAFLP